MQEVSPLQKEREEYKVQVPFILQEVARLSPIFGEKTEAKGDVAEIATLFENTYGQPIVTLEPKEIMQSFALKVGVVFSGGQASGGHNVIAGLLDGLLSIHPESKLYGFLNGPSGIVENKTKEITPSVIETYRNQGGFDLIGSGRTKIETEEQLQSSLKTCQSLELDGIVIIGGDDSNTNAALLAEYLKKNECPTSVIGVPKTIDGDLRNEYIPISFGFDTACKTYSELIGNIARDSLSAKKYYHFIRLMGRSASHIALECSIATHPNYTLIGEEVSFQKKTIMQIAQDLANMIEQRAQIDKNYGVVLIPEGLIEFIPEMKVLISSLNNLLAKDSTHSQKIENMEKADEKIQYVASLLENECKKTFASLPFSIQTQLLLDRDPHGNVQVSLIETEKLLIEMVKSELSKRKNNGTYKGSFKVLSHFFGYEGRAAMPSNFDATYCYNHGLIAASLICSKLTGYMTCLDKIQMPIKHWEAKGIPITMLMNMETRHGKQKPVIQKALVDLNSPIFKEWKKESIQWILNDYYRYPGPIQYFGKEDVVGSLPFTISR
ncbi:MAG TPA: diphosphate--fructose-6-phosphate 1-phosphotransferase [Chlamydiales bacterium]|nr:diphosphate--fructose-6-phosphate 1-phosphotransferase [Chlamydiales bacterium]